jgi:fibronectin-binding autotransporter adhesin
MKPRHQSHLSLAVRSSNLPNLAGSPSSGLLGVMGITFLLVYASPLASAATATWDGAAGSPGNWDADNWSGGGGVDGAPIAGDILTFVGNTQNSTTNNFAAGTTFGGINFTNNNQAGLTNGFVLGGNAITLGGNISTTTPTGPDGTITDIIDLNLILDANRTISVNRSSNKIHNLTVNGVISGDFTLAKRGNAFLTLTNASNSFTGLTIGGATTGSLTVNSIANSGVNSAFGSGSLITFDGGLLNYSGAVAGETNRAISLMGGGGAIHNNASGGVSIEFKGTVSNDSTSSKTFTLGGNTGSANLLAGNLANNTGALSFVKNGTSTWILSGNNTYTGNTTIDAGTVSISKIADTGTETNLGNAGNIQFGFGNGGGGLTFTGAGGSTARQVIIGKFNGANGGGGATISNTGADGGSGLRFTNAIFNMQESSANTSTRGLALTGSNTDANEIAGTIQNAVNSGGTNTPLSKTGVGRWILGGANSYTGTTTVSGGVLQLNNASALGGGNLTLNGGILGLGAADLTRSLGTGAGQVQITSTVVSGFAAYGGTRAVNLGASVSWTVGGFFASGSNTMALSHTTATGTLDFQSAIDLSGFPRTFDVANGSADIDAKLSGTISGVAGVSAATLIKAGLGTLELTADNSYTGLTNVSAGTLIINGNQSLAVGAVSVTGKLTGSGTVGGATTINSAGIHNAGNPTVDGGVGTQAFSSSLNYANGSIFEWDLNANDNASGFDTVSAVGNITVGTSTVFKVVFGTEVDLTKAFWSTPHSTKEWSMESIFGKDFNSGSFSSVVSTANPATQGSFSITGSSLTWTAVPEPTSALAGLLITAGLLRRRRA